MSNWRNEKLPHRLKILIHTLIRPNYRNKKLINILFIALWLLNVILYYTTLDYTIDYIIFFNFSEGEKG